MAKIPLSEGFTLIPEGTHIFKITAVNYKESFGKLEVTMKTKGGATHVERFSLLKKDGSPNEGALNAFSYFAKTALNDFSLQEIDHNDLVGHFIECDIEHDVQPNKNNPEKTIAFARLDDKRVADGFDGVEQDEEPEPVKETKKPEATPKAAKGAVDLKALLG